MIKNVPIVYPITRKREVTLEVSSSSSVVIVVTRFKTKRDLAGNKGKCSIFTHSMDAQ